MKPVRLLPVVILAFVALPGCSTRNDAYDTMADVREARLIEKGWLPDFMPRSTHDLHIRRDVEDASAEGSFKLDASDYATFTSKLRPWLDARSRVPAQNEMIGRMRGEGASAWTYSKGSYHWVFLCDTRGQECSFAVW
jgi:hypothetical protein